MILRGDGVAEFSVVGQSHMEAGNPRLLQQRDEDGQLLLQHAGVSIVWILLTHGQFIVNGHVGQTAADGGHRLHRKAGPVFGAAAVAIGTMVKDGGTEAAAHPVPVDLDHVKSRLDGQFGRFAEGVCDLLHFFLRQAGNVRPHLLVQQRPQFLHRDALGEHTGDVFDHPLQVGVGLVELGTQLTPVGVLRTAVPDP